MQSRVNRPKDSRVQRQKQNTGGEKNAETTVGENHDRENESEKKNKKK